MARRCLHLKLGLVEYGRALELQRAAAAARESGGLPDLLITLQHPPVLTLGRRANRGNIVASRELLLERGVRIHQSNRGGDVTYHGPGQLVGYPILGLRELRIGVASYVHGLEKAIIDCLHGFGIGARQDPHYIGVWVGGEKLAAIGVAVSGGVTTHGFALNVDPDLSHFGLITPCGITDRGVTSMARLLGRRFTVEDVLPGLVESLSRVLEIEVEPCDLTLLEQRGIVVPSQTEFVAHEPDPPGG